MRIKVGNLVEVCRYGVGVVMGLVTEITNPQYGMPPVYWVKFAEDGEELRVGHSDIMRVIR